MKVLIRFDDLCHNMNWEIWDKLEIILDKYNVKPILAVIPNNADPKIDYGNYRTDFWNVVREWQKKGWTIAIHGYDHMYINRYSGIIGITNHSEFAHIGYEAQRQKLTKAQEIFTTEGIYSNIFIAPSHSFDKDTLRILKELNIYIICDGFAPNIYIDKHGLIWIPCQKWNFRKLLGNKLYTICIHHNSFSDHDVQQFEVNIEKNLRNIVSVQELHVESAYRLGLLGFISMHYSNHIARLRKVNREIQNFFRSFVR
jgi:predicted deacetylase